MQQDRYFCGTRTTIISLPACTEGLKRQIGITMKSASRTISPVPSISPYAQASEPEA